MNTLEIVPTYIEGKVSKAGKKYWSVSTESNVDYTVFDEPVVTQLVLNKPIKVNVAISDNWKNIRSIADPAAVISKDMIVEAPKQQDKYTDARASKDASMYTSYAKDVFIRLIEDEHYEHKAEIAMNAAIDLVKQAREAFS